DVEDADAGMVRCEPLDTADALLDDHWVPGQVEVYENISDLKIDALRPRFGRDDDVEVGRVFPESLDGVLVALSGGPVDDTDPQPPLFEEGLDGGLRLQPPRENHHAPALCIFSGHLIDQRAKTLELSARFHTGHDAAHGGGEVLWHSAIPCH